MRNRLLAMLPTQELQRLMPLMHPVTLDVGQVLYRPGEDIDLVYFPIDSVVSVLFEVDGTRTVEVAMEGNEGAVGVATFLGGGTSYNLSTVRHAGSALQLPVSDLVALARQPGELLGLLRRYLHALGTQIAQSGICNRFHEIDARLARWLLMTVDRTGSTTLQATQASVAHMLGVRRSTVSNAASGFHKRGVIDYRRGRIQILNRDLLLADCCDCYGIIKRQYDTFLE